MCVRFARIAAHVIFMLIAEIPEYTSAMNVGMKCIDTNDAEVVEKTTENIIENTKDYTLKELSKIK